MNVYLPLSAQLTRLFEDPRVMSKNNEPRGVASGTNRASEVMEGDSHHPSLGSSGSGAAAPGNYTWAGSRRKLALRPEHEV